MSGTELIGWVGALVLVASAFVVDVLRSRQLYLVACAFLVAYTAMGRMWPLLAANVVLAVIGVLRILGLREQSPDAPHAGFAVIEVGPQDEYLRHLLRIHGRDILEHQPGFVWDGAAPGRRAAIVTHGAETVGFILFHEASPGVAQIELDYVTPRFRNSDPGRYVFEQSGVFARWGYTRIVTPPGMREAYYERLRFVRDGDRFVHDIPTRG